MQFSDQQGFTTEEYDMMKACNQKIADDIINNPFDFVINVGDITQNGNRINEWIDYFKNAEMIFDTKEQMFSIGNNDLCPVDVHELGRGADADKTNPINATYFFTFEHPNTIPTSAAGVYVPCTYDFVYGDTYFLSVNSEITDAAREKLYGDNGDINVYDNLKSWCEKSLEIIKQDSKINWRVAFCHEAPFTIMTAQLMVDYQADNTTTRDGSHLNTVGGYFFSKFLQENDFKLCMCGHKHTYTNSRLIHDNAYQELDSATENMVWKQTMVPSVYEPEGESAEWYTKLPDMSKACVKLSQDKTLGWVKYAMTQACGYKLVSNKELPAQFIPWLLGYYPVTTQSVENGTATVAKNTAQEFPNYIIWNIGTGTETEDVNGAKESRKRIVGKSYKLQRIDGKNGSKGIWPGYKYLSPTTADELEIVGGNGVYDTSRGSWAQSNDNIIVEHNL
jgi:hypothetical protein